MKIGKILLGILVTAVIIGANFPILTQGGQAGAALSAEVTATGFYENIITYDWAIEKSVNPTELVFNETEGGVITYNITVNRIEASNITQYGVRGVVNVTNGGNVSTENLKIVVRVQYKGSGQFQDLPDASVTIIPSQQLGPGETGTYEYEIVFTPVAGAQYRVAAKVTITNHSGHLGVEWGPEPKCDFSLPATPAIIYIDEEASVDDVQEIPTGFNASTGQTFPVIFYDSGYITFTKQITHIDAPPGIYYLNNTATLTETDTKETRTATATVAITVLESYGEEPEPYEGLSHGYWKTHTGSWIGYTTNTKIKDVFNRTAYLPYTTIGELTLLQALNYKGGKTIQDAAGILLRQAVAALLNAAHPDINYPLAEDQIIIAVNAALNSEERQTILNLAEELDGYNNLGAIL
ncbi:MAG: hypothetical protein QXW78_05020 [Candidatus Thermoplasmatota archaeon]